MGASIKIEGSLSLKRR